jgi:hypothetical protein
VIASAQAGIICGRGGGTSTTSRGGGPDGGVAGQQFRDMAGNAWNYLDFPAARGDLHRVTPVSTFPRLILASGGERAVFCPAVPRTAK